MSREDLSIWKKEKQMYTYCKKSPGYIYFPAMPIIRGRGVGEWVLMSAMSFELGPIVFLRQSNFKENIPHPAGNYNLLPYLIGIRINT